MAVTAPDVFLSMLDAPSVEAPMRPRLHDDAPYLARRGEAIPEREAIPEQPKAPEPRPPWADDIDRIVAGMVARGEVVFNASSGEYRRPHVRRWRFGYRP